MKIYVHCLVKNEENFVWYSIMSVISFVDKILIWDTGSTDKTVEIIKTIERLYPDKIYFKEVGEVDINEFTGIRQKMLSETDSDWLILVDGDEVWWEESISNLVSIINKSGSKLDSIVSKYTNLIGDIYHSQDNGAGKYKIDGRTGFYTIRAMNRKIDGLKVDKPHGQQGFFNKDGTLIQDMDQKRRLFIDKPAYLHFTNLSRSSVGFDIKVPKRKMKYKYELGRSFPLDFYYPEVFFKIRPDIVLSPWDLRSGLYVLRAAFETPLKMLKRKFLLEKKSGY